MQLKTILTTFFIAISQSLLLSQIIWADPPLPTPGQPVTIFFDATQGAGGLANCSCDVYLHTGLITSLSTSNSDWKYVVTTWGQANAAWKMTPVSGQPNKYSYTISPSIKGYYSFTSQTEVIQKMAFVFRNANGTKEGKATGGADIFYTVYPDNASFTASLTNPTAHSMLTQNGAVIPVKGAASQDATLSLYDNGNLVYTTVGTALDYSLMVASGGTHLVEFKAVLGNNTVVQSFTYAVPGTTVTEALPAGAEHGINYLSNTEVLFALYAPNKSHVFLLGDFNDWNFNTNYQLKRTPDGKTWWIKISGLTPGEYYAFQYVVDGTIRIGDPYSNIVLDPSNDGFITAATFPNMPPYPIGKTAGIASVIQPGAPAYNWQVNNFQRPDQENIVIYELLLRDFLHQHDFQTLKNTLDYLEDLGVNAIELMPVNEFDGNISWGYNPSYHYALDKYYGSPEAFKALVDECHARGISVILDVVFNHASGASPLAQLYWDAANNRPAADNPWLNPVAKHDFNVFNDFNHESAATKEYVKKCLQHWMTEYRIDGFRFDLSKGFTQKNTLGNVSAWGQYDAGRIAILKDYADLMWNIDPAAYVILEHFADISEEKALADYGMMLWAGGLHDQYKEAAMGYTSDLTFVSYKSKGWNDPHLVAYMESHDEERMMYKNLQYGNSSGGYNVKSLPTALDRVELASAFFYTVPGPKMLWQFGELGYDFPIDYCVNGTINSNCRTDPKPIRWLYAYDANRLDVYNAVRSLLHLRNNYEVFQTADFDLNATQKGKVIHLNHASMNVTVLGNFDVATLNIVPAFQHTGWWYEYFTGDSLNVSNVNAAIGFQPGEYRLYTDAKVAKPGKLTDSKEAVEEKLNWTVSPNPASYRSTVSFSLNKSAEVQLSVFTLQGQAVATLTNEPLPAGDHNIELPEVPGAGMYIIRLWVDGKTESKKIVIMR